MKIYILAIISICFLSSSCISSPRDISKDEIELVSWFVEDLSHNIKRSPYELRTVEPTEAMQRISKWLGCYAIIDENKFMIPNIIKQRQYAWKLLRPHIKSNEITIENSIIKANSSKLSKDILELIEEENQNREELTHLITERAKASPYSKMAKKIYKEMKKARKFLDESF